MKKTLTITDDLTVGRAQKVFPAKKNDGWTQPAHTAVMSVQQEHEVTVEIEIDWNGLAHFLGHKAANNSRRVSKIQGGLVVARVIKTKPTGKRQELPEGFEEMK